MEAAEANAVVGAILWLAQTIMETLQPGVLHAWLHRVGLAGAIGELKSEVERMETVVNGVGGRAVGNKPLARSLARVKELMYDADDVVDELDYCRLQQQVEGGIPAPATEPEGMVGDAAEQVDASANTAVMLAPHIEPEGMVGDGAEHADASASTVDISDNNRPKNRSKERDYFDITPAGDGQPARAKCIDCGTQVVFSHGTSVLRKHRNSASCKKKRAAIQEAPNWPSASDSVQNDATVLINDSEGRKRMRIEYSVATTTHLGGKAKFLERVQEIALELRCIRGNVIEYLKDSVASSDQYQSNNTSDMRVRTSGSLHGRVYGRHNEKEYIMSVTEDAKLDNITVLPIVGIVGVGKTALAKLVYNDQLVKKQFERIWIWVSNIFDEVRVTREVLDIVTLNSHGVSPRDRESYEGLSNYTKLQEVLKKHMAFQTKKFMLVLDDVNDCMNDSQWKDLLDALGSSCTKGNVIIVTTRNLSIAQRLGTVKPVTLGALSDEDCWLFFKACAFGDSNYMGHLDIGRQISAKLEGNPLAAENAAEMLREHPTNDHWESIMKNGVWESLQFRGGILSALKISYHQLPYHLQQCFLVCSIFPRNHKFHIDGLVYMWISLRFVKSIEMGRDYLNALVNSCFLEQVETQGSTLQDKKFYAVCGLLHEFARLVSRTEFDIINGLECKEVLPTVRHLLILTDSVYHIDGRGIVPRNLKFEEKLESLVSSVKRLRTLIFIGHYDPLFFQSFISNSVNCTHLRYLKLGNGSREDLALFFIINWIKMSHEALPISLSKFHHLEVLDTGCLAIHGISDLLSMMHLVLTNGRLCGASTPAWPACLKTIHLESCTGWETLPSLEGLSFLTKLKLRNMREVTNLLIPSLEELVLIELPKLNKCLTNSVRDLNSSLRILEIRGCQELMFFTLFETCEKIEIEQKSWLPNVNELTVHGCPHLMISNPLPPSSRFCKLSIGELFTLDMEGSTNGEMKISRPSSYLMFPNLLPLDDKILSFHNLMTITQLEIFAWEKLSYFSIGGLRQLVCLKRLEICSCNIISSSDVLSTRAREDMAAAEFDALPSLECLKIKHCGIIGGWLSVMLQHVRALEELHLFGCRQITGLLIEGEENSFSNLTLAPRASSHGNPDGTSTGSCLDKLLHVPSSLVPSLKKMHIELCELKFLGNKEGFSGFTSLEKLIIAHCPKMISSLGTLQPCFLRDLTRLTVLEVSGMDELKSLQLHSCTALEKLKVEKCKSLDALEGVQSLRSLRNLKVRNCPGLPQYLESLSMQGYELCPQLKRLQIDRPSFLTAQFCKHLTSLQCLQLKGKYESIDAVEYLLFMVKYEYIEAVGLTYEQEEALQLLTSLQQLRFEGYLKLLDLPVGLHSLFSLNQLEIIGCPSISRLPERGLPPSLEELNVHDCSKELTEQCRMLATSKLAVIIDKEYVN